MKELQTPAAGASAQTSRYVIARTFPAGALQDFDAQARARVSATNAAHGVRWLMSYANAEKTRTLCVYEGPNEHAIREASRANQIPVDSVTEVPVTLMP